MSAAPEACLDSNILVYAFTNDARAARAQELLQQGCAISVQALNEFANVARRKLGMSWPELHEALAALRKLCPTILPLDVEVHEAALRIAEGYGYSVFDSLMVGAALLARCRLFWSEDLQDGALIEGQLRIANTFRSA